LAGVKAILNWCTTPSLQTSSSSPFINHFIYLFVLLDLFFFVLDWYFFLFIGGFYFVLNDLVYFIEWDIITLNSTRVVITFLFDCISLVFIGFVFLITSLVILYRDDYIHGDLNINRFILLALMFVLSIMFLIVRHNIISILL
jgi:NADH-ubiquinone oxidoreductase chain 5